MKKQFLTVFIVSFLAAAVCAQTNTNSSPPANSRSGTQTTTAQPSELAEAARLNAQVVKLYGEGEYEEALPLAKRALEIRERRLGSEHDQTLASLVNLAAIYLATKKYAESIPLHERLLSTYEKKYGVSDPKLVSVINSLALARYARNDYGKAEDLYLRALAIRENALGAEHAEVAQSAYNLAEFYHLREKYGKAEPFYQRAIAIWGKMLPTSRQNLINALEHYILLSVKQRRDAQATALQKQLQEVVTVNANSSNNETNPVESGILTGRAIAKVAPAYPEEARQARVVGTVIVQITVDESGRVIEAKAVSGHPALKDAAVQAARRWRFAPTQMSGRPVKVTGTVTFNFTK